VRFETGYTEETGLANYRSAAVMGTTACSDIGPDRSLIQCALALSLISQNLGKTRRSIMPKYLIERNIPGASKLSQQELQAISQKSCGVLNKMGPQINWVHSYVAGDKIYCVYIAPNEAMIREHAQQGGFPANVISEVTSVIDPTTGGA
jgi:hypothetical protein